MKIAPLSLSNAIWRFLSGTGCEPSSTTIWPGRADWTRPCGPCTTSSRASVEGMQDSTMSAWAPTSAAECAATPPIFSNSASEERRKPTTRRPLLIKFCEIGRPILPTPTKPMVSMNVPSILLVCFCRMVARPCRDCHSPRSCHVDRPVREVNAHAQRSLHHRPFLQLESAQPVDEERIAFGERAGLGGALGAQDGQPLSARRSLAVGQRAGGEDKTAPLEPDHVFQMRQQERLQLVRRRNGLRQHHIELLAQHFFHQFGNALFEEH